jgi:plastocyanin
MNGQASANATKVPWRLGPRACDGARMNKLIASLAATGALAAAVSPALAATKTVRVSDDKFTAKNITVKKGTKVTWKWVGSDSHNVVGKGFKSKLQNKGTYSHTFTKKGSFRYVCTLHEGKGMVGKVVVK